jgi:hypothetical protein
MTTMAAPHIAPGQAPNAELLHSLRQLVRGLSALFWGLPVALIICVQTAKTEIFRPFGLVPPVSVAAWLCFGLWKLGSFQKQERVWTQALDRTKVLAIFDLGLSPFLYWWNQVPDQPFFTSVVSVLGFTGLLFLGHLNLVLHRLSAMLPDEGLREETRQFTVFNRCFILGIFLIGLVLASVLRFPVLLPLDLQFLAFDGGNTVWLIVFLVLLPLAMTMALIWKIKEVILDSIFGGVR